MNEPEVDAQKNIYTKELPLPVQRHLAKRGHHLNFFVRSAEKLITDEIFRHLTSQNISRLLVPDINERFFKEVLERHHGLFSEHGAIMKALKHPKCDLSFAKKFVANSRITIRDLNSIRNSTRANRNVKYYIKRTKFKNEILTEQYKKK